MKLPNFKRWNEKILHRYHQKSKSTTKKNNLADPRVCYQKTRQRQSLERKKVRAEQRTAKSNCCRVEWHSQNSRITSQALIRGKILLFFLMPRNEWRGCGRRDGGEHISTFKNRIKMNELWESCYRLNRITRLEEKAKSINTIFFLFPSSELIEPVEITTWSF